MNWFEISRSTFSRCLWNEIKRNTFFYELWNEIKRNTLSRKLLWIDLKFLEPLFPVLIYLKKSQIATECFSLLHLPLFWLPFKWNTRGNYGKWKIVFLGWNEFKICDLNIIVYRMLINWKKTYHLIMYEWIWLMQHKWTKNNWINLNKYSHFL